MRNLRSQEKIMSTWQGDPDRPLVSISCITYNHEPYIEDTLEGFLIQETNFPFEILIHDDASTDGTPKIIRKYELKYPKIIKPIYRKINQYSKGRNVLVFNDKRAQGEYIAICEGDDYWTEPKKLQIQIDAMKNFSECNICFHPAIAKYQDYENADFIICNHSSVTKIYHLEDGILHNGAYMPTCSILIKKKTVDTLPIWYEKSLIADLPLQILGSFRNGALYLPFVGSVYRVAVSGSWSENINKNSILAYNNLLKILCLYEKINKSTLFEFSADINHIAAEHVIWFLKKSHVTYTHKKSIYKKNYKILKVSDRFLWYIWYQYSSLYYKLKIELKKIYLNKKK